MAPLYDRVLRQPGNNLEGMIFQHKKLMEPGFNLALMVPGQTAFWGSPMEVIY